MAEATVEEVVEKREGFPIENGLVVELGGLSATIIDGHLVFDVNKEQTFHAVLNKTGQLGLYEDKFKLKYDSFSNLLPFELQDVKIQDLESYEATAFGVLPEWEEIKKAELAADLDKKDKKDLIADLKAKQVEFDPKAGKEELIQRLIQVTVIQ